MARFEIYTPEETKKEGRLQRFYRWICIPFRRRAHSYIEPIHKVVSSPTPPIELVNLRPYHPLEDPSSSLYQTQESEPPVHRNQEPEETHQPRGRYREARPQHPASHALNQQTPPKCTEQVVSEQRPSIPATREGVESPTYDAPQVNGKRRSRSKTEKNKDLPGVLRAEPPPLTREFLESNERRHSGGSWLIDNVADAPTSNYLIDNIPGAPALRVRRWSNDSRTSVRPDAWAQFARDDQRVRGHSNSRQRRNSDRYRNPHSRQSSATRQAHPNSHSRQSSADRQSARASLPRYMHGGSLPSRAKVVPLRDDSERVLVHSKSRGFKVVRNLLSLDKLKDQPRHMNSLEEIAAEKQRSEQEFASKYSRSSLLLMGSVW
jgi:hypothetical protein